MFGHVKFHKKWAKSPPEQNKKLEHEKELKNWFISDLVKNIFTYFKIRKFYQLPLGIKLQLLRLILIGQFSKTQQANLKSHYTSLLPLDCCRQKRLEALKLPKTQESCEIWFCLQHALSVILRKDLREQSLHLVYLNLSLLQKITPSAPVYALLYIFIKVGFIDQCTHFRR